MIIDSLDRLAGYAGLNPRFSIVADYLSRLDLAHLAPARYDIDGENIFMTVTDAQLRKAEEAPLEVHDRYTDIQILIAGNESFGWADRSTLTSPRGEMDPDKDILFFDDCPSGFVTLRPGQMVIFALHDAHAPLIGDGTVRKVIVKVKA